MVHNLFHLMFKWLTKKYVNWGQGGLMDSLVSDREKFDSFMYLSLPDALEEINRRQEDNVLESYVKRVFADGMPGFIKDNKSLVIFRHVATTNHEILRFLMATDALEERNPVILEYTSDRFLNRNEWKHSLGKIRFDKGVNKSGQRTFESKVIIDFNNSDNLPIRDVKTLWGQSLVDFHHELFQISHPKYLSKVHDISDWISKHGPDAKSYYQKFFTLFLRDAVLFENFLLEKNEKSFTRNVILPAVLKLQKETGYKPIVVALEPTDVEGDDFWLSHPYSDKMILDQKMAQIK